MAGAVILPGSDEAEWIPLLRDSKQLTAAARERLAARIWGEAEAAAVAAVGPEEIDRDGIAVASRRAMQLAVKGLRPRPCALLVDAFYIAEVPLPQERVIRGDARCSAIAAASIIAKVARDRMMVELAGTYPAYGFERNRGYGTGEHLTALSLHGPSPIHRRSFAPLRLAEAGE